jgi:hypothetical protein
MTTNPSPPPKPAERRRDTLIWIVPVTLVAFLYWSVANYLASVEYAGQVPDDVRNGQYAATTFILGFLGFIIAYKRRTFKEGDSPARGGNWGLAFGGIVTAFFWILSVWFFMNSAQI